MGAGLAPGRIIDERYRLIVEIGSGAHGVVYRARDLETGDEVALKFLGAAVALDPEYNERLAREATAHGHAFNNFYEDIVDTGINSRVNACLKIEGNVFQNAQNPYVSAYSDVLGGGQLACNVLSGSTAFAYSGDVHELPTCMASVPYAYGQVLTHPDSVPSVVSNNAGVGKLGDPADF